jgi:hypothetical protein
MRETAHIAWGPEVRNCPNSGAKAIEEAGLRRRVLCNIKISVFPLRNFYYRLTN